MSHPFMPFKKYSLRRNYMSTQSAENYLETIYMLTQKNGSVRSVDIATELGFSKPSVSVAMKNLRENGYVEVMGDGSIVLLEPGKEIAESLYKRHTILTQALTYLYLVVLFLFFYCASRILLF